MLSKVKSFTYCGVSGYAIDIEVAIFRGMPSFETVGLPGAAVKESKERVRSAIANSLYEFPIKKITLNLAPADIKKEGPLFDLPIAIAILIASGQLRLKRDIAEYVIIGELSLDGGVKGVRGILPILISAFQCGYTHFIIPAENAQEASYVDGIEVLAIDKLKDCVDYLEGADLGLVPHKQYVPQTVSQDDNDVDFRDIKGQSAAKRAIEIAVAGGHNILMKGPPGTGKTMLARCVPTIMPPMSFAEALEVTKIHSIAGILDNTKGIVLRRPFRSPHHTTTAISLVGGGSNAKPGEVSLAHNGVLFLDELPEYNRHTIETLRQPLEDGHITISRINQSLDYAADFMLIASMNPCPCGYYGSKSHVCNCTPVAIRNYLNKLSAPLLDRIDIQVEVYSITFGELRGKADEESSATIAARVAAAREIQRKRFGDSGIYTNSRIPNAAIKKWCALDKDGEKLLEMAFDRLNLSARAVNRILKVARTIADLAGETNIKSSHLSEAINYRTLDIKG